jgi:cysteine desulfurase family protein (TIGR01976 family)
MDGEPAVVSGLDLETLRAAFPALRRRINGQDVAYFDGPGGTQVPRTVADAVHAYLLEHNANAGWSYPSSHETDAILAAGRRAFADFFGGGPDEVAFGPNMTTLTLRISRALGRELRPGDPVVVTELDHHANVDPWKALAAERGARIRVVRMDPATGLLDLDHLERCLDGARILALGAASNAIGTMPDVPAAAALARAAGATTFVDAVHFAPHELPDVRAMGADFVAVSPYKFYGPHLGVVWGRKARIEALELPRVESAPDTAPARIETGTLAFEAVAGATAAVDFLAALGRAPGAPSAPHASARSDPSPDPSPGSSPDPPYPGGRRAALDRAYAALRERGDALFRRLWEALDGTPGVRLHGLPPGSRRTPTLGLGLEGVDPVHATRALAERAVFITHGDFYATTVVRRLGYGPGGMLRAGCVAYTTEEEVDRLATGLRALARTA